MEKRNQLLAACSLAALGLANGTAEAAETQTYNYDDLGRLTGVSYSGTVNNGQKHTMCYDTTDNRTRYRSDPSGAAATCPSPVVVPTPPPPAPPPPPPPPPPPNNPPVANADAVTVKVCLSTTKNVTANDTDPDGDLPLTVTAVGTTSLADVYIVNASTIGVTAYGTPGSANVSYTIKDSRNATASGTLTITVQNGTGCS